MPITPESNIALILTTIGADADAVKLGRTLVAERLAACVNVLPVMTSIYRWQGRVEEEREQQLLMKTAADGWWRSPRASASSIPTRCPSSSCWRVPECGVSEWIATRRPSLDPAVNSVG